jgi:diketogulonate reductase-like aldo/keto reductase
MDIPVLKLNTGAEISAIGFGTWQLSPPHATQSVTDALEAGYRLIDTAKIYRNEQAVGEAVRSSNIPRQEIFLTTKLWQGDLGYDSAHRAIDESLDKLGLDYVDLYLIHWPGDNKDKRFDSWRAMAEIYQSGKAKAVGVSNFTVRHLQELLAKTDLVPAVNQIEFHPYLYGDQKALLEFCKQHNIVFEAYSPLARGLVDNDLLIKIGQKYSKTSSQVMLSWAIQKGTVPLPRSSNPQHINENFDVFDFKLSEDDIKNIDGLSSGRRQSWDPTDLP